MRRERLIVIGNGIAGGRVVEDILDRGGGERFEITMFGAEPHGSYNRIMLSGVLAGTQDTRDIFLNPLDWYERNGIALHAGVEVVAIERGARTVTASDGSTHAYDKLVIATGSRPLLPPVEGLRSDDGALRPGVYAFRTLADCEAMITSARGARRAVVVGGGLLGLEAARGLLERGLAVDLVHRPERLMNIQLDEEASAMLRASVESTGIRVHLGASTVRVLGDAAAEGVELADGSRLAADMVVFATGVIPNVELAQRAGFPVERGIVVDDAMRVVGCDDVYALGECVQHRGIVHGLVAPIWGQSKVLADRITGSDTEAEYGGSRPVTKLKVSGVDLATIGVAEPEHEHDEVIRYSEPRRGIYKSAIVRDGKLVGAILLGDLSRVHSLTQAFDRGTALPAERAGLLFALSSAPGQASVEDLPDDAQICNCNGVSKGQIRACVLAGNRSVLDVARQTRATTGCGTCRDRVLEVIESTPAQRTATETVAAA